MDKCQIRLVVLDTAKPSHPKEFAGLAGNWRWRFGKSALSTLLAAQPKVRAVG